MGNPAAAPVLFDEAFSSDFHAVQRFKGEWGKNYRLGRDYAYGDDEKLYVIGYNIRTLHRPRRKPEEGDFPFEAWEYDDEFMAVLLPTKSAGKVIKKWPRSRLHLDTDEGKLILFPKEDVDRMAEDLKLWRKRKLSPAQRDRVANMGRETLKKYHSSKL